MKDHQKGMIAPLLVLLVFMLLVSVVYILQSFAPPSESTAPLSQKTEAPVAPESFEVSPGFLVGIWQNSTEVGSGWGTRYQFFASGLYNYRGSQANCDNIEDGHSGYWNFSGVTLELAPLTEIQLTNVPANPTPAQCGTPQEVPVVESSMQSLRIENCPQSTAKYICLLFDGTPFYKFSSDPLYGGDAGLEKEPVAN